MANNIGLFFNTSKNTRSFAEVLAQVQEYLASKYSTLITDNPEEQRQQITAYIAKYLNDYSLGVEGMDHEALIDKLYTEMAEFSFLTPYLFACDVEEININSWKDTKITYADGRVVPSKERFQSPQHAVDVVRRLLHKSGMILDNSQKVVGIELLAAAQALWLRGESLLAPATAAVYQKIRQTVPPVDTDVVMYPQMAELDRLVKSGALLEAAEQVCGRLL